MTAKNGLNPKIEVISGSNPHEWDTWNHQPLDPNYNSAVISKNDFFQNIVVLCELKKGWPQELMEATTSAATSNNCVVSAHQMWVPFHAPHLRQDQCMSRAHKFLQCLLRGAVPTTLTSCQRPTVMPSSMNRIADHEIWNKTGGFSWGRNLV